MVADKFKEVLNQLQGDDRESQIFSVAKNVMTETIGDTELHAPKHLTLVEQMDWHQKK